MRTPVTPDNPAAEDGDEALLQRYRSGDAAAGEKLVRLYSVALLRYLQRLVGSDHLAEELHQQTWISVLEHLDRFQSTAGGGGFKSWLYRIATNKANDHWRSRGREASATRGLRLVTDESAPEASAPLQETEEQQKLRRAIELLPENQRQILLLRYYSNLKFVEIAQMLGCPLNTALGRMHKAILRLRTLMSEPVEGESKSMT